MNKTLSGWSDSNQIQQNTVDIKHEEDQDDDQDSDDSDDDEEEEKINFQSSKFS